MIDAKVLLSVTPTAAPPPPPLDEPVPVPLSLPPPPPPVPTVMLFDGLALPALSERTETVAVHVPEAVEEVICQFNGDSVVPALTVPRVWDAGADPDAMLQAPDTLRVVRTLSAFVEGGAVTPTLT